MNDEDKRKLFRVLKGKDDKYENDYEEEMCPDCQLKNYLVEDVVDKILNNKMTIKEGLLELYDIAFQLGFMDFLQMEIVSKIELLNDLAGTDLIEFDYSDNEW